jgi:hypothetical protein
MKRAVAALLCLVLPAIAQTPGAFTNTGTMTTPRAGHTATLLPDGRVLIAGGDNPATVLDTAEIYDPATGLFTPTGGMTTPRSGHSATLLADSKVLLAGGNGPGHAPVAAAELYDPSTATFTATGEYDHRPDRARGRAPRQRKSIDRRRRAGPAPP